MMKKWPYLQFTLFVALLCGLTACTAVRRPPVVVAPAEPEPARAPEFPSSLAWTARADVQVLTEGGEVIIPNPFTRVNVLRVDTLGIHVRCLYCIPTVDGLLPREDLVYEPLRPDSAARHGLAEFLLAVREAASRRDEEALRPVMARDFTFSLAGGAGPLDAFHRWRFQGYRALDNLPPLLDRGVVTRDSVIWSAPPAFLEDPEYHGLRAGFRRSAEGRWEWIYLVGWD
jgi:hypothetical protein